MLLPPLLPPLLSPVLAAGMTVTGGIRCEGAPVRRRD